jgi:hypothetical protein
VVTHRATVAGWIEAYEAAWRTPGTELRAELFTEDASYQQSPYMPPVSGLGAIGRMWERERGGPDEVVTPATEIVAVDGPVAVVRAEVRLGDPLRQEYRDLWVLLLEAGGLCRRFEG